MDIVKCNSYPKCTIDIVWCQTVPKKIGDAPKRTPIDAQSSENGRYFIDDTTTPPTARYIGPYHPDAVKMAKAGDLHVAHWGTCVERERYHKKAAR